MASAKPPSRRILIVDDSLDTLHALAYFLKQAGHEVRFAIDGHSAVKVAAEFRPEVVFLDLVLPGLDGFEVARQLKQDASRIRIFAVTGHDREDFRARSKQIGFDAFLVKPLESSLLDKLLANGLPN